MKKLFLVAIVALCGAFASNAQTIEYRNEVYKILDKTSNVEYLSDMLYNMFQAQYSGTFTDSNLKSMCRELSEVIYPDLRDAAVKAYYEIFTLDELKQLNEFYSTPVGVKLTNNMNTITAITNQTLLAPEVQQKLVNVITKYMNK